MEISEFKKIYKPKGPGEPKNAVDEVLEFLFSVDDPHKAVLAEIDKVLANGPLGKEKK